MTLLEASQLAVTSTVKDTTCKVADASIRKSTFGTTDSVTYESAYKCVRVATSLVTHWATIEATVDGNRDAIGEETEEAVGVLSP